MHVRYQSVLLLFGAAFVSYMDRVGFPIVYSSLAGKANIPLSIQGSVHSAFYYGYAATQVPGGWAAAKFGATRVLAVSFLCWGVFTILTPDDAANTFEMWWCRVFVGGAMGVIFPACHNIIAEMFPAHERTRAVSFTTSGTSFGSAFVIWLVPTMAHALGGYHWIPKVVGSLALLWLAVWMMKIKMIERTNKKNEKTADTNEEEGSTGHGHTHTCEKTPWIALLKTPALWAIVVNSFTLHYAVFIMMAWLPTFYEQKLHLDHGAHKMLKMLPYIVMALSANLVGMLADKLISSGVDITLTRKLLNTLGFLGTVLSFWCLPKCESAWSAGLISSLALGTLALARGGFAVNHMDIAAPRLSGVLMGIVNTVGSFAGMVGPWATGLLLERSKDPWAAAFAAPNYLMVFGIIVYLKFATAKKLFD